jgi:hypothetical protein
VGTLEFHLPLKLLIWDPDRVLLYSRLMGNKPDLDARLLNRINRALAAQEKLLDDNAERGAVAEQVIETLSELTAAVAALKEQQDKLESKLGGMNGHSSQSPSDLVIGSLTEPKNFSELFEATGLPADQLRCALESLLDSGDVEKSGGTNPVYNLPESWARLRQDSDFQEILDIVRKLISSEPRRQGELAKIMGADHGGGDRQYKQISDALQRLKKEGAEPVKEEGRKGARPWFLPPRIQEMEKPSDKRKAPKAKAKGRR